MSCVFWNTWSRKSSSARSLAERRGRTARLVSVARRKGDQAADDGRGRGADRPQLGHAFVLQRVDAVEVDKDALDETLEQ